MASTVRRANEIWNWTGHRGLDILAVWAVNSGALWNYPRRNKENINVLYKKLVCAAAAMAVGLGVLANAIAEDNPTPQAIIDKFVKATGGADKWKAVKSESRKGTLNVVAMGMTGSLTSAVQGNNAKQVMALDGFGEFLSGVKEGKAWSSNMMQGDVLLEGDDAKQALSQLDLARWVNWQNHFKSAETVGEEAVGDSPAWKVNFTPETGDPQTFWFAKDTGLIIQSYGPGMGGPATTTYKDYKEVDGLLVAHTMSIEGMNGPVEMTFESIEFNKEIDPTTFDVPETIAALMK